MLKGLKTYTKLIIISMIVRLNLNHYKSIQDDYKLVYFQKEYLISMMNNLSYLNTVNIYESESLYLSILDELKLIKNELDKYNCISTQKSVHIKKNNKESSIKKKYNIIHSLLISYSNHISPSNINFIFKLFLNNNMKNEIDKEKMDFLTKFIRPISIWDSEYHKIVVPYIIKDNPNKQKKSIAKELIESILGIQTNDANIKSLINTFDNTNSVVIKSIGDLIDINNNYDYIDSLNVLANTNFQITKNNKSVSLIEDKHGVNIYIKYNKRIIIIQGIIIDDLLNVANSYNFVQAKIKLCKSSLSYDLLNIPKSFKDNYLKIQNLRDVITATKLELVEDVKKKYNDFKYLQSKTLVDLINEFILSSKYRKIDILTLLLISNDDDQKLAYVLFDVFKSKDKKNVAFDIYSSLHHSIRELLDISQQNVQNDDQKLSKITENDIPYERRISMMKVSDDIKAKALDKLKLFKSNPQNDGKAQNWLDGLLKIPFGIYSENDIMNFKDNFIKKIDGKNKLFSDNDIDNYLFNNNNNNNNNNDNI